VNDSEKFNISGNFMKDTCESDFARGEIMNTNIDVVDDEAEEDFIPSNIETLATEVGQTPAEYFINEFNIRNPGEPLTADNILIAGPDTFGYEYRIIIVPNCDCLGDEEMYAFLGVARRTNGGVYIYAADNQILVEYRWDRRLPGVQRVGDDTIER
jgi:hypothetical protein